MTKEVKERIIELYPTHSNAEIAHLVGLTEKQVKNFVFRYNEKQGFRRIKKKESI